jgi:hypothetical protein
MVNSVRPSSAPRFGGDPVHASVYVAQPGDTAEGIAALFGLSAPAEREEFYRLNPMLGGGEITAGTRVYVPGARGRSPGPSEPMVEPSPATPAETAWTKRYGRGIDQQNRYNGDIDAARAQWPALPPEILKSLLAQESGFRPDVVNRYGYAGIAQLGVQEARAVGLSTGSSRMRSRRASAEFDRARDQRFDPSKAIPGAVALLRMKAQTLDQGLVMRGTRLAGFGELGRPSGDDYWRFVAAAYNGGEGTVLLALYYAYGNTPPAEVRWSDLVTGPGGDVTRSPLWRACRRFFANPAAKYTEISEYARDVVLRARQ